MGTANQQLQQAYEAIKAGRKEEAIDLLLPILQADDNNAQAWWLMANALRDPDDIRESLENVLRLQPGYDKAQQMLDKLNARYPRKPKPPADYAFDEDDPFANEDDTPPHQPRPRAAGDQPMTAVKSRGKNSPLLIILAFVGVTALLACGACLTLPTLTVTLFGQQLSQITNNPANTALGEYILKGTIQRGQTVQATVDTFDDDGWRFNGNAGEQLTIEVSARSSRLDPQLYIHRPDNTLLAENDDIDFPNNTNSRLQVTLPSAGVYTIVISAFGSGGDYSLTVR